LVIFSNGLYQSYSRFLLLLALFLFNEII